MKYVLRIRSKPIITKFQSGIHIFWGCYWIIPILIKMIYSCRILLRKCKGQLGCEVKETGISPSPGAMLTISLQDMSGPSILCITVGKGKKDIFISLSFSILLPSISSTPSVWSSILNSLPLSFVRSFKNSGSDCSLKIFQSLSTITFL